MGNKIILFFSSSSCKACKPFRPIVEKIAKEFGYVFQYVDVNKDPAIASDYGVMSLPTTVVENNGQTYKKVGASSEERFRKEIQDNIG